MRKPGAKKACTLLGGREPIPLSGKSRELPLGCPTPARCWLEWGFSRALTCRILILLQGGWAAYLSGDVRLSGFPRRLSAPFPPAALPPHRAGLAQSSLAGELRRCSFGITDIGWVARACTSRISSHYLRQVLRPAHLLDGEGGRKSAPGFFDAQQPLLRELQFFATSRAATSRRLTRIENKWDLYSSDSCI